METQDTWQILPAKPSHRGQKTFWHVHFHFSKKISFFVNHTYPPHSIPFHSIYISKNGRLKLDTQYSIHKAWNGSHYYITRGKMAVSPLLFFSKKGNFNEPWHRLSGKFIALSFNVKMVNTGMKNASLFIFQKLPMRNFAF